MQPPADMAVGVGDGPMPLYGAGHWDMNAKAQRDSGNVQLVPQSRTDVRRGRPGA